jgi:hypothetical protein
MAADMPEATLKDWEDAFLKDELEPEDKIFWAEEREKYMHVLRPEAQEVQGPPPPPKPWYQHFMDAYAAGDPSDPTTAVARATERDKPGVQLEAEQDFGTGVKEGARLALEHSPDVFSMLAPGPGAMMALFRRAPWLIAKLAPEALRALKYYGAQQVATRAANVVDPEHYTNPNTSAAWTAGGEAGGRLLAAVPQWGLQKVKDAWTPTPYQADIIKTVEDLHGPTTLGMGSEKAWPQWTDVGLTHSALGGRVRNVYEQAKTLVDEALDAVRGRHPGGTVDEAIDTMTGAVKAQAHGPLLDQVPRQVRDTTARVIDATEAKHVQAYQDLDTSYRQQMVHWRPSAIQVPTVTSEADLLVHPGMKPPGGLGPGSIFTETVQLTNGLRNLPPAVTLDGIYDMYVRNHALMREALTHVEEAEKTAAASGQALSPLTQSIKLKVLEVLGTNQDLLNKQLAPYLVDRGGAQEVAKRVIGTWEESLKVPELAMQRGQAGRVGILEDPQVMAARSLLEKPRYGLFTDVHQDRQQFLQIGRMQGPNLGNNIAREANEVAGALDATIDRTGNRIAPKLSPQWRSANAAYKADAEVLNSPLIQELAEKNLDDILTTSVMNERPNDLKTLRKFLGKNAVGADVMDEVADMWLTRKISKFTDPLTGVLDTRGLRDELHELTAVAEHQLFPRGLRPVKQRLRQAIGMEDAVGEIGQGEKASVFKLRQHKNTVGDPALWQHVQSDVLATILTGKKGLPLDGDHILTALGKIDKISGVLFDPDHLKELTALAHTSRVLQQVHQSGKLAWSPMVRMIGHGVLIPGAVAGATQYVTGDPYKAALAGGAYLVGTAGLSALLTNQKAVGYLRRLMSTPANTQAYGELLGAFMGELAARNMSHLIERVPTPETPQVQGPPEVSGRGPR